MSFVGNSYKSVRRGDGGGCRGFRLNPRRFYVHRIRTRFLNLFRMLGRWKTSYVRALRSLRRAMNGGKRGKNHHHHHHQYGKNSNSNSNSNNRVTREMNYALYRGSCDCNLKSFGRSNSFYTEAIADCLDFIKRNSVSLEEEKPVLISSQS